MPRCVKCNDYFHPDYCIETNIRGEFTYTTKYCKSNLKGVK